MTYACIVAFSVLALTTPVHAQSAIPVRTLTAPVGTDSGVLRAYNNIRPLRDGRLLVNDFTSRRLLLFDSTMARFTVVLDSAADAVARYGPQQGILFPYMADSTVLLDQTARALVVIDPAGKVGRTMAIPGKATLMWLGSAANGGHAGFDPAGRLVYQSIRSSQPRGPNPPPTPDSGTVRIALRRDSVVILRIDPDAGTVDTIAYVALPASKSSTLYTGRGTSGTSARNPLPTTDEWALLPDGTAAIVRGHDYHIDWVLPNGTTASTPKMAFDWRRVTDEEKQQMIDSLRLADSVRAANAPPPPPPDPNNPFQRLTGPRAPPVYFEPSELPDYYPPVRAATVKADAEGNVWVLPTTSAVAGSGLVYDLINRKGEVFERVKLPEGRNLMAVGAGGVVYMSYTPKGGLIRLERARVVR